MIPKVFVHNQTSYNKQKIAINYIQAILIVSKEGGKNCVKISEMSISSMASHKILNKVL